MLRLPMIEASGVRREPCLVLAGLLTIQLWRPAKNERWVGGQGVTNATPNPNQIAPSPKTALSLESIHMVSETAGWAMINRYPFRTSNGGTTWQNVSPSLKGATKEYIPVFILDGETAWVEERLEARSLGLFRTTDAGRTWQKVTLPDAGGWYQFLDRDHGWVFSNLGVAMGSSRVQIRQTADGGDSWHLVNDTTGKGNEPAGSLPFGGIKSGVAFRDSSNGWAAGYQPTPGGPWFYVTHDGGQTWQQVDPQFDVKESVQLDFATPTAGWILTKTGLFQSADGGRTWKQVQTGQSSSKASPESLRN